MPRMKGPRVDPVLARIARGLGPVDLMTDESDDAEAHFAEYYSEAGLRRVAVAYGLHDELVALGFGDWRISIQRDDPFHHRLTVFVGDVDDTAHRLMDLRLHLASMAVQGASDDAHRPDVVVIEWLLMQNPRAAFSAQRPRLPGQLHPGLGVGRKMQDVLVLMAQRISRDALLNVPEHAHLAETYTALGWRFLDGARAEPMVTALAAAQALPYAHRAWALERGFVVDDAGAPFRYDPQPLVFPVSKRLRADLAADDGVFARLARRVQIAAGSLRWHVDEAGLRASLVGDPVEGVDPVW